MTDQAPGREDHGGSKSSASDRFVATQVIATSRKERRLGVHMAFGQRAPDLRILTQPSPITLLGVTAVLAFSMLSSLVLGSPVLAQNHPAGDAHATNLVPFVGCPVHGQLRLEPPPHGEPVSVAVPADLAKRIAFYTGTGAGGMPAPRGWHCVGRSGSWGFQLLVTPVRVDPLSSRPIRSPAVYITVLEMDTSGEWPAADIVAAAFSHSVRGRAFVDHAHADAKANGLVPDPFPDSDFEMKAIPTDRLQYLNDLAVEYESPAKTSGLGTYELLSASDLPIHGLVVLPDSDSGDLIMIGVRLPRQLAPMAQAILQFERKCYVQQHNCVP